MKISSLFAAITAFASVFGAAVVGAEPDSVNSTLQLSSGERRVALVELYTSEGCSSCPPADRWLSEFTESPKLWEEVVPLSFHVDYWDWIGWRDRFAHADYSNRQRRHVKDGNAGAVYTPGFFANGQEWRGFFEGDALNVETHEVGELALTVKDRVVSVRFKPLQPTANARVNVALLGMGLQTQVASGENRGKNLPHDFVVLSLKTRKLDERAGQLRAELRLPRGPHEDAAAIAAWVSGEDSLRPLQAVGGFFR